MSKDWSIPSLTYLYESHLIDEESSPFKTEGPVIGLLWANLEEVNLRKAYLGRAYLAEANLQGANLGGTNLENTNLEWANLRKAYLGGANLENADLLGAEGLTQQQLNKAFGSESTKLPDHLQRPAHWCKGDEGPSKEG